MKSDLHTPATLAMSNAERFLNVSPVREVSSAPHSRSCSFKKASRRLPQGLGDLTDDLRPRTNSLPSRPLGAAARHRHSSDPADQDRDKLFRVRSFKQTSKGLVKHGDSFKRRSTHSLMSTGSTATDLSAAASIRPRTLSMASEESSGIVSGSGSCCAPSYFRVVLMGAPGVGKSALIRQFMTSEYRGTFDIVTPDAEDPETTVSVMLDGEESMVEFIDHPQESELESVRADAFVVVFSLADLGSFTCAISMVRHLRVDLGLDRAILLVANKVDLARQKRVHLADARVVAMKYDCRLEETSAALNHQVDELLVTILSQIRLRLAPPPDCLSPSSFSSSSSSSLQPPPSPRASKPRSPSPFRAMSFLSKLFAHQSKKKAKSCDNLFIQ